MIDFSELSDDELEAELKRRREEKKWKPRDIRDFSDEEKVKAFDAIYGKCKEWWDSAKEDGRWDDDADHHISEDTIEICFGKGVFDDWESHFEEGE